MFSDAKLDKAVAFDISMPVKKFESINNIINLKLKNIFFFLQRDDK
jgi:hypothetical protein